MNLQLRSHANRYVDELLRLEGRGDWMALCGGCSGALPGGLGLRCDDCHDLGLYCVPCCVEAHLRHPLHRIQVSRFGALHYRSATNALMDTTSDLLTAMERRTVRSRSPSHAGHEGSTWSSPQHEVSKCYSVH